MKTRHDGDCNIYASIDNTDMPEAGICTCGYGHQLNRKGDSSQMYSEERLQNQLQELEKKGRNSVSLEDAIRELEKGGREKK